MRIFETRHGQVLPKRYYQDNPSFPVGDMPLSELGEEQARLVGKRLKELHFNGVIYSSPYARTLKTADIIAGEVGSRVIPLVCLREISKAKEVTEHTAGTGAELLSKYQRLEVELDKVYTWRDEKPEELSTVIDRLKEGLAPILSNQPKGVDVLLVGHAATSVALRHLFEVEEDNREFHWNCHLSLLYSTSGECYTNDVSHLPISMWTGNSLNYCENKQKFEKLIAEAKEFLKSNEGSKVLHISDTHSASYLYYQKLIEELSPDVIIHTGDLADELKAGRIENARGYWRKTAAVILRMMENSSARVIVVPGNNDLEEDLKKLVERVEVVSRNTVLELYGKKFLLCHEINRMDEGIVADIYLYGHGLTGETRTSQDNVRDGKRFYNGIWGASLHVSEKNEGIILPKVEI